MCRKCSDMAGALVETNERLLALVERLADQVSLPKEQQLDRIIEKETTRRSEPTLPRVSSFRPDANNLSDNDISVDVPAGSGGMGVG